MRLQRCYRPWLVSAESRDPHRAFRYVLIERNGSYGDVAVASDGYVLAVVPIWLADEDIDGIVSAQSLRLAAMLARRDAAGLSIALERDQISVALPFGGEVALPRRCEEDVPTMPDWQRLVTLATRGEPSIVGTLVDMRRLARVARALGRETFCLVVRGDSSPVLVQEASARELRPPFGLVMPLAREERQP